MRESDFFYPVIEKSSLLFPLTPGLKMSATPVRVTGHKGQVLAATFIAAFNTLITAGEKDRMIRQDYTDSKPWGYIFFNFENIGTGCVVVGGCAIESTPGANSV